MKTFLKKLWKADVDLLFKNEPYAELPFTLHWMPYVLITFVAFAYWFNGLLPDIHAVVFHAYACVGFLLFYSVVVIMRLVCKIHEVRRSPQSS
jgi:hypothetical protein